MQIEYISASRLNTYVNCPFKYFLTYELKLPELREDTIHTAKGSAVHESLEKYAKGEKNYVQTLIEFYRKTKLWTLDSRPEHKGFPHPQEKACSTCKWAIDGGMTCGIAGEFVDLFDGCPKGNFEDDLSLIEKTIGRKDSPLSRKIIGAEVSFDEKFEGFRVHGYIDIVTQLSDDTIEVSDYKTGNYAKNSDDAFKDLQMRIYSLVAKRLFPQYEYVMMTLDYLRKRPVTVIFNKKDDEKTLNFLQEAYRKISQDQDPKRIKSFMCSWCVGYDRCGEIRQRFIKDGKFQMPEKGKRLPTL